MQTLCELPALSSIAGLVKEGRRAPYGDDVRVLLKS